MDDDLNAFCSYKKIDLRGAGSGSLSGLTFAVKDIYDIVGERTGAGSVDWLNTHAPATRTANVVERLLAAGAHLRGVTHSTELTRGIVGDNVHYGTPRNPRAPGRVPGGSSSGSASAVAGGVVDFALGSDTNGSISVPASFCGVFGIKSTHGRLSLEGVFKHAPSFDTVGWFARSPLILERVGRVLFDGKRSPDVPAQVLIADDAFALADASVQASLRDAVLVFERLGLTVKSARFCPVGLDELYDARYVLHGREAWQTFRPWFEQVNPRVSYQVLEKCIRGGLFSDQEETQARRLVDGVRSRMEQVFAGRTLVCLPATASVAWEADVQMATIADSYRRTSMLVSIGSALNVPQLTVPIAHCDGIPVGLSLLGERGSDEVLLAFARHMVRE